MIPEIHRAAMDRALREAFEVPELEDVQPLTGGQTAALVYRIVVEGSPYLLRISQAPPGLTDQSAHFRCMGIAAEAGVAPAVRYASVEDGLSITHFVEPRPLPEDAGELIADSIARLHAQPGFHRSPMGGGFLDFIDGTVERFRSAGLLAGPETDELLRLYAEVSAAYPRNADEWVASHNDLKPQNILYDGERFVFVDWEAAFLNDPYVDLAVVANFHVQGSAAEDHYLEAYFGRAPDELERARFFLMSQAVHVSYTTFLVILAARSGAEIDAGQAVPDFAELHRSIASGETDTLEAGAQVKYALVHRSKALEEMSRDRFSAAVSLLSRQA
jgi:aminoglycoside phosphotransferase (APT) family kinase protein